MREKYVAASVSGIEFLQLFHVDHDLEGSTELDSEALDEGLVGEEQERRSVDFLLAEDGRVVPAVGRALEELDDLLNGPGTDVNRET